MGNPGSCILAHVIYRSENSSRVCFCWSILPLRQAANFYKFAKNSFQKSAWLIPCLSFIFIHYMEFPFTRDQKLIFGTNISGVRQGSILLKISKSIDKAISVTSHEGNGVLNRWKIVCSFSSLFRLTTKAIPKFRIVRETSRSVIGSPHKQQQKRNEDKFPQPCLHDEWGTRQQHQGSLGPSSL